MRHFSHKTVSTLFLGILLCFVSIAHGCNAPVLSALIEAPSAEVASGDDEKKFCTCSLKKQADDFLAQRFTQKDTVVIHADDTATDSLVSTFFYETHVLAIHAPPPQYTEIEQQPRTQWTVLLPRGQLHIV